MLYLKRGLRVTFGGHTLRGIKMLLFFNGSFNIIKVYFNCIFSGII